MQDINAAKLSSIRTYLLVAMIFNILVLLIWLVWTLLLILVVVGLIFLVPLIISVLTLRRIMRMRSAAAAGDVATLKQLNSTGWAIIALIFAGIIPGIMLLISDGSITELSTSTFSPGAPAAAPSVPQTDFKFCPSCGARLAKSATFCSSCGAKQP